MVTPADELALVERLIRIDTKLDVALAQQADHEGRIRALEQDNSPGGHMDHEGRIRRIEKLWLAAGTAAAGGGVLGQLLAALVN
jgi:hypothetical protein